MKIPLGVSATAAWGRDAVFALLAFAALTVYSTAGFDATLEKWLALALLAAYCAGALAWRALRDGVAQADRMDWIATAFAGFAALSLAWSADRAAGAVFVVKFAGLWLVLKYVKDLAGERGLLLICAAVAAAVLAVAAMAAWNLVAAQGILTHGGFGNANMVAEFLLAGVPLAAALFTLGSRAWAAAAGVVLAAALGYLLFLNDSKIGFLVVPLAAVLLFLASGAAAWKKAALAVAVIAGFAVLAFFGWEQFHTGKGFRLSMSIRAALDINGLHAFLDRPLWGHGIGSTEVIYPLYQDRHTAWITLPETLVESAEMFTGPLHNDFLQLAVDLGLVGAALAAALIWYGLKALRAATPPRPAYAWGAAGTLAILVADMGINFPLQLPATSLLAALAGGILANRGRAALSPTRYPLNVAGRAAVGAGAAGFAALLAFWGPRQFEADRLMVQALEPRRFEYRPDEAYALNLRAHERYPYDRHGRIQLPLTLLQWRIAARAGGPAPEQADRAFGIGLAADPYSMELLVARVEYLLDSGRYTETGPEVEALLARLREIGPRVLEGYVLDAQYRLLTGDTPRARQSLAEALRIRAEQAGRPPPPLYRRLSGVPDELLVWEQQRRTQEVELLLARLAAAVGLPPPPPVR